MCESVCVCVCVRVHVSPMLWVPYKHSHIVGTCLPFGNKSPHNVIIKVSGEGFN